MDNTHYWEEKDIRANKALKATAYIENHYFDDIDFGVNSSTIYGENATQPKPAEVKLDRQSILVVPMDSVSALYEYGEGKTCVLNFASFRHPGGHYLNGSKAQEECLCSESILYNVLRRFDTFYAWNSNHNNNHLYVNRAIYSSILFNRDKNYSRFDVLTCAAPNFSSASKYCNVSKDENEAVLKDRIDFIIDILNEQKVDTVILGAFGCGVFGQNATVVANYFKEAIKRLNAKIVFAVLESKYDTNYQQFVRVFS